MKPIESSQATTSDIGQLFREYHASHVNRTNQIIHYICVPLIYWSITAMLWSVPLAGGFNLAMLAVLLSLVYYLLKSFRLFTIMALFAGACLLLNYWLAGHLTLWTLGLAVFVAAWIGQFIGHHIEGKRPSFFKDLQFLMIGPAWVVARWMNMRF